MARKLLFARAKRELAATLGASPPAPRLAPTSASDDETLLDGHMRLYAFYTPALEGGRYTISASQTITAYEENDAQSTTLQNQQLVKSQHDPKVLVPGPKVVQAFNVVAPQFSLDPKFINTYYPPNGEHDEGRILPHMVFNDPHVPWLRDAGLTSWATDPISGAPTGKSWAGRTKVPWMGLLVFQPENLRVTAADAKLLGLDGLDAWTKSIPDKPPADLSYSMNVSDFMRLKSRVLIETGLTPGSEDWNDMMGSTEQTRAIFPAKDQVLKIFSVNGAGTSLAPLNSLQMMSHVRHVNNKGLPDYDPLGTSYFSVVVSGMTGNVTETQLTTHIVHLVSIEHLDTTITQGLKGPSDRIALISLFSWNYQCVPESVDFTTTAEALAANAQPLRAPDTVIHQFSEKIGNEKDQAGKAGMQALLSRLQHGYTISRWRDALGEESIAFNRSPLVPVHVKSQPQSSTTVVPHQPSADWPVTSMTGKNYQIFDESVGVLDATYDSAWSLGKLMAISDPTFTAALMRLRSRTNAMASSATLMEVNNMTSKKTILASAHEAIAATHGLVSNGAYGPVSRLNPSPRTAGPMGLSHSQVKPILREKTMAAVEARSLSSSGTVFTGLDGAPPADSDWEIISNWIHDTLYLDKIPSQYLFPDPSFLRAYLDASTLPKTLTKLHPEALRYFSIDDTWLDCYIDGGLSVANHNDPEHDITRLSIKRMINQALATGGVSGTPIPVPRSGFVVRSAIIKAAPDIRVKVTRFRFDDTSTWVEDAAYDPLLRHTRLDDYTILCLLDTPLDQICKITLAQPPHQQRFAFSVQPTIDPDTGAVTAITNDLQVSALYTNEKVAPEGHGAAGKWPKLPDEFQFTSTQEAALYDYTIRCIAPDEIARQVNKQLGAWSAAASNSPYTDTAPDSCVVGLLLNDPCYQLVISGSTPTAPSRFKSGTRQLWVGLLKSQSLIESVASSGSAQNAPATASSKSSAPLPLRQAPRALATSPYGESASAVSKATTTGCSSAQSPIKVPHFDEEALANTPVSLLHPNKLHLHSTSVIPRSLAAAPPRPSRQPTLPPPNDFADCQFELLVHPDYRQPPPRPSPPWKFDSHANFSPQTQLPITPIYLYDLVLAVRRRLRHTPGTFELQELFIEIPVEDPSDTHNPADNMWREPLLVSGDYSGKGVQMTGNDRFVPTLSNTDHSSDDGKACLRITLIPRTGEAQGTVLLKDDSASAEASVRLAEVRLAQIVDFRTKVMIVRQKGHPPINTPAGRCFVKMTEVYASGQPPQVSWATVLKTKERDQDGKGHDL